MEYMKSKKPLAVPQDETYKIKNYPYPMKYSREFATGNLADYDQNSDSLFKFAWNAAVASRGDTLDGSSHMPGIQPVLFVVGFIKIPFAFGYYSMTRPFLYNTERRMKIAQKKAFDSKTNLEENLN